VGPSHGMLKIIVSDRVGGLWVETLDRVGKPSAGGKLMLAAEGKPDPEMIWTPQSLAGPLRGFHGLPPGRYRIIWTFDLVPSPLDINWLKREMGKADSVEVLERVEVRTTSRRGAD
jgi:hypothetical protein